MIPALFLIINSFYITLQSHFIFGGDSAEYSTVAKTWGIAHPPGYPLYSFLINIVNRLIPFGTTPWKVALLSSIPTVITAYVIYRVLCLVKLHKYIAFAASILYLFLFPVWQYALIPEVFALHTMLISLITYLLLRFLQNNNKRLLLAVSLLCGLSISHHHIFILFIPGWIFLLKGKLKKIYDDKQLLMRMGVFLCLGASVYLYTIIVSLNNTPIDWENAKTLEGFFRLITRSAYGSFKAYSTSGANIVNQISDMVSGVTFILLDFKPLGIIFICLGMYARRKYGKQFSYFLFISLVFHFVFLFYTNFVLTNSISDGMFERFLIPLYVVLILFLGMGMDYFYKKYYLSIVTIIKNANLRIMAKASYFVFIGIFIFVIAQQNYKTISFIAQEATFEQFGKDILDTVPQGGILSTQGDTTTFTSSYRLYGLKERNDLLLFQLGLMGKANYIAMIKKRFPALVLQVTIKNTEQYKQFVVQNWERGYYSDAEMGIGTWRPYGLLWKYYPDNAAASSNSAALLADNERFWEQVYTIPILSPYEKNIFHLNSVGEYYLHAYQNYAKLLVFMNKYAEAEVVLKNIVDRYKKNDPQSTATYMNLLVHEKKCAQAGQVARQIGLDDIIKKYPGFVKSALAYLQACDPQNGAIPEYSRLLFEYEKNAKTDLNSF